jgi:hypothetical protein
LKISLACFLYSRINTNNLHFGFPQGSAKLAMTSVSDVGGVVAKIFDHPVDYNGRTVGVVGEDRTCAEYAHIFSKVLDRNVYYHHIPRDIFIGFDFPPGRKVGRCFRGAAVIYFKSPYRPD